MRIEKEVIHTIEIDRSRFITYLNRCFNEEEAREYIASVKKLHPEANHHCTAFICNQNMTQRTNDDGEPSKTAGKPMLDILLKNDMEDICAVVVRYFGGIKLGAGGLIRAYGKSVNEALSVSSKVLPTKMNLYELTFGYEYIDKLEYLLKDTTILHKDYDEIVSFQFITNHPELLIEIQEITKGQYIPTFIDIIEIEQPILL
ncbi:MAG: YigZ family protein [Erysipelotrichaceae bacterium]